MNCAQANELIHDYLDGDLNSEQMRAMHDHVDRCKSCLSVFEQLQRTDLLAFGTLNFSASRCSFDAELQSRIMEQIPFKRRRLLRRLGRTMRKPRAIASLTGLLILGVLTVTFIAEDFQRMSVSGEHLNSIIIENTHVIVPADVVVTGDLHVKHGEAYIYGTVTGDVIVWDGRIVQDSQANIGGQQQQLGWLEYMWYKVTHTITE